MNLSATTILPTEFGRFNFSVYLDVDNKEQLVLWIGDFSDNEPVLVRVHSECITGEVFHSLTCDCGPQLMESFKKIGEIGRGALIYLRQEGRGIGLINKIRVYNLEGQGVDTVDANLQLGFPADSRTYEVAAEILTNLGVKRINLMTNNPDKIQQLKELGIVIEKRIPLEIPPNGVDNFYLKTKKKKMGHLLTQV